MSRLTIPFHTGATRRQWGAAARAARALVLLVLAGIGGVAGPSLAAMAAAPRVVVDIKPVHALVAGVMNGIAVPRLLIAGAASPHDYALRPSDARALAAADLVVWVGPALTPSLEKPLGALAGQARRLTLLDDPAMVARDRAGAIDPHIWLDPAKAIKIVADVARALIALDPAHGASYSANAATLAARLRALDKELAARLAPVADVPYAVFHDAFGHLERRYGLSDVGAIALGPGRAPGAGRLRAIRRAIAEAGAVCVFAEPQFEPALARIAAAGSGARLATLDPLGADLPAGPGAYVSLLRAVAKNLVDCLSS